MTEDRVFITTIGSPARERLLAGTFGFIVALIAALILVGIERLTGFSHRLWILAAMVIPLCAEAFSWITSRGAVSAEDGKLMMRQWWRYRELAGKELVEVSCHGPRVMISASTGETISLEWPWYLSKKERNARAATMCSTIKRLLAATEERMAR